MDNNNESSEPPENPNKNKTFKRKAALFLAAVSGTAAIVGFSGTIAAARKRDPEHFEKGVIPTRGIHETGVSLGLRALAWGTFYAFTGCGLFFYGVWKLSGAKDFQDFRIKMGEILPRIKKNNPPQGRTEFSGLNDLLTYLEEQKTSKDDKKSSKK